jgi:hypothetical protein
MGDDLADNGHRERWDGLKPETRAFFDRFAASYRAAAELGEPVPA